MTGRLACLTALALAAALFATAPAAAPTVSAKGTADAKAGSAIAPAAPSPAELKTLDDYPTAILALVRGKGGERLVRQAGGVPVFPELALWRVNGSVAIQLASRLKRRGALRYAGPDHVVARANHTTPGEPLMSLQQELGMIGAFAAEPPGPGVPVTVIDDGIDVSHPEFAGRPNTVLLNAHSFPGGPTETHGTAVASIVGAPMNGFGMQGVYPQAVIRSWDVGSTTGYSCSDVLAAIRGSVASARRGVINMSFGGARRCPGDEDAVAFAFRAGSLLVASAGNERDEGNTPSFPASLNHVLTVAATDLSEPPNPSGFSNENLAVDLAAPGQEILVSSRARAELFDLLFGTSYSAPMVSAAAAWVWTVRPDLDNTQIFDLMRYSTRDIGPRGYDAASGFGLLNIPNALGGQAPPRDPQEPNDDVHHVRANGLFAQPAAPITRPGRGSARISAALDITEDPTDVYRAWVPARRTLRVRLAPNRDVDLEIFRTTARTIYYANPAQARRNGLVAGSYGRGNAAESVAFRNTSRAGTFVYVAAFIPDNGPLDASYTLLATTTAR